ncbi:sigma-70 family RNA polymerase sigma factor [Pseudarthrobacter albicanus]|uniref:sigma-70 family RNA polymerase sigma factor n=1 Tax=Pseudarthrobacter albicanus TaxID=2823873 RepID=UPI001BA57BC3|nr:sigma-70 family RNA polymerase sigma factor [Pseudarthrobacter albicanus]
MAPDEDVVAAIYSEHGSALRRFVLSASRDPVLADGIVHETVLRVQQAPKTSGSMRSYLFRTARNVLIDNHRTSQRRPQEGEERDVADPVRATERIDVLNRVPMEEALMRLSREHLDVLVALHYRRFTVGEASAQLNIPTGLVKSRAFHAVRALRTILDGWGQIGEQQGTP